MISATGTVGKVVLVGDQFPKGILFDTSIRRLRLRDDFQPRAHEIADFLRSDVGNLQFQRLSAGAVISHINKAHLGQIRIFLPTHSETQPPPSGEAASPPRDTYSENIERQLRGILEQIEKAERSEWQAPVAAKLRKLATELAPPTLEERIRRDYPAPLAIPYRRYVMASHNPYEQIDRMINLVEACTYFVFHLLVADLSRVSWRDELPWSSVKRALKSRASFSDRIQFIRHMTKAVHERGDDLFVSGLATCDAAGDMDVFRDELRNQVAHSAPGAEPYVEGLVAKYNGRLHDLLRKLSFLSNYTMCRVRSHFFQRGVWRYRCEIYRGEEYDVNLKTVALPSEDGGVRLLAAERDHLVLVSPEFEFLDLWPYYQLHFSEQTCRESHLCVAKHIAMAESKIVGESVRSGIEVEALPGFADYFRV